MSNLTDRIRHELAELLPPTLFFLVALHIIALIRALMNRHTGIELETSAQVSLAALVLGKSVLLANLLPFINRYPDEPLVWNVSWKTLLYALVSLGIHYLERLYAFWREAPSLAAANQSLVASIVWPHFWALQIVLALMILMYCVMAELGAALGPGRMKEMFFGPLPARPH
jgi:hypothetical protein